LPATTWFGDPVYREEQLLQVIDGYAYVRRDGVLRAVSLARMILEAFEGPPPARIHRFHHIDGDKSNFKLSNLAWGTKKQRPRIVAKEKKILIKQFKADAIARKIKQKNQLEMEKLELRKRLVFVRG
jgi:hypothetical protein